MGMERLRIPDLGLESGAGGVVLLWGVPEGEVRGRAVIGASEGAEKRRSSAYHAYSELRASWMLYMTAYTAYET